MLFNPYSHHLTADKFQCIVSELIFPQKVEHQDTAANLWCVSGAGSIVLQDTQGYASCKCIQVAELSSWPPAMEKSKLNILSWLVLVAFSAHKI